jgi:thioredoxin reductase (NADPH)
MRREEHHDVVILGGGAAGVSCGLECVDIQLDTVVVEAGTSLGGQLAEIPHSVRNVATGRFENGRALQEALITAAAGLGDRVRLGQAVTAVDVERWCVDTDDCRFYGRAIVVATGTERQSLAGAADGAFGGDVTYLLESEPERFVGRVVAVIGGGDSATLDALALARTGSAVKLVYRGAELTARHDIVEQVRAETGIEELAGWELETARGGDRLEEIVVVRKATGERRTLAVGGLVVKIARVPSTAVFARQLDLDRKGAVVVDSELRTRRAGVFAAGDVVSGSYWRVATAVGHGSLAARSVLRHLEGRG